MASILIITYYFVPYSKSFGSCARCVYLSKYLVDQGYDVSVLAAGGVYTGYFGHDNISDNMNITYVGNVRHAVSNTHLTKNKSTTRKGAIYKIAHVLESRYLIPDRHVIKLPLFWRRVKRIIAERNPAAVIVSAPPHGISPIAYFIKISYPDIKVFLDYRDSWNTTTIFAKRSKLAARVSTWLEKRILEAVDYLVHVSPIVPELIFKQLHINVRSKSLLIMNGFPAAYVPARIDNISACKAKPMIGYFGVINDRKDGYRDISFIFDLVDKHHPECRFIFWGEMELTGHNIDRYTPDIEYRGHVEHKDAITTASICDALLVVHTDPKSAEEVIPGKLFDYIAAKRPIICIAPRFSQVAIMVEALKIGVVIDPSDPDALVDNLNETIRNISLMVTKMHDVPILDYTRESQFAKLLPFLGRA